MSILFAIATLGTLRALMRAWLLALGGLAAAITFPAYSARHRVAITLDLTTVGTFSRSTEGSYLIKAPTDGTAAFLAWASSSVRRIEDRGDGLGSMLLMEGSRTNLIKSSRDVTNATYWASSPGAATITANDMTAPDGGTTATRVQASASGYTRGQNLLTLLTNPHVLSAYVRGKSGSTAFASDYGAAALVNTISSTTWARISQSEASTGGVLYAVNRAYATGAIDCGIDLFQAESAPFPSSPIRTTTTSVTRGADNLSIASGSYPASLLSNGFTIIVASDGSSAEIVSGSLDCRVIQVGVSDYLRIRNSSGSCVIDLVCGGTVVATKTVTFSRGQALTLTVQPAVGTLTVAGATTGNGSNTGTGAAWASSATLYVGTDSSFANPFFGRLSNPVML